MLNKNASAKRRRAVVDPDDAPELDHAFFDRAEIAKDGKIIRRSRPASVVDGKETVTLWIDRDVLAHYRATGKGWQTGINATLRRAARLGNEPTIKAARLKGGKVTKRAGR
jgi:uncharacterized protein (DUF4415 family)